MLFLGKLLLLVMVVSVITFGATLLLSDGNYADASTYEKLDTILEIASILAEVSAIGLCLVIVVWLLFGE